MKKTLFFVLCCLLFTGCMSAMQKPDIGPTGAPLTATPNPPLLQRFEAAPDNLYDMEAAAGVIFEGINQEKWDQAEQGLTTLATVWSQTKAVIGDKKGVKEADDALTKLQTNLSEKKITASYESLNAFMGSISEIGKSYKLSPVSDLITVGNDLRNVSFYVEDKNWTKAASKVKELEDTWNQVKPGLEQVGILSEITITHAHVKQLKDAVNAENKASCEEQFQHLNESLGKIRQFYRGK